jgi:hypothetical protein
VSAVRTSTTDVVAGATIVGGAVGGGLVGRALAGSSPSIATTVVMSAAVAVATVVVLIATSSPRHAEVSVTRVTRRDDVTEMSTPDAAPRVRVRANSTAASPGAFATGRVPQCPRCGAFSPSVDPSPNRDTAFAFTCAACAHTWTWSRNDAWPAVRINPRVRAS